jgi:hypothetical protein
MKHTEPMKMQYSQCNRNSHNWIHSPWVENMTTDSHYKSTVKYFWNICSYTTTSRITEELWKSHRLTLVDILQRSRNWKKNTSRDQYSKKVPLNFPHSGNSHVTTVSYIPHDKPKKKTSLVINQHCARAAGSPSDLHKTVINLY